MDHDADGKLKMLTRFAEQLRTLSFPTSPISIDLAKYVADSINSYLDHSAATLDAAFGLRGKRGRPTKTSEHLAMARNIGAMRIQGKSWKNISDEFGSFEDGVTDERTLRRIWDEHRWTLWAEELSAPWSDDNESGA